VQLDIDWHAAEADQGYDTKAAQWQQKLDKQNAVLATENPACAPDKEPVNHSCYEAVLPLVFKHLV
jgi:hypothetical protein